ncbi:MAG: response regulator, partial [Terriglobales bacterium]
SCIGWTMRILVVEDEHKVAQFIKKGLQQDRFAVDLAADGEEALYLAEAGGYDLIILDLMLPKVTGFSVLSTVRKKNPNVPILILTAKTSVEDRVRGLEIGSDDYLIKPFAFAELRARVRALLRREWRELKLQLQVADLVLDPVKRKAWRAEADLELSNKEFMLLEYLMRNANQVVTRTMIAEHVWDASFDSFTNVIDVYISFLRTKIDKDRPMKLLHSVRGVGYMLKDEAVPA